MIDTLLDNLPLCALPRLPSWQARSLAEGNALMGLLTSLHAADIAWAEQRTPQDPPRGFSISARRQLAFEVRTDDQGRFSFRESIWCPLTNMNARARMGYHMLLSLLEDPDGADIYLTEETTPLFQLLAGQNARVQGSEYLPHVAPGTRDAHGIRSEDLTRLTYGDASFDAILSLDVLEHVPDFRAALQECARVLRPGGKLVLTAPFAWTPEHVVRARVSADGQIEHLLPAEYHGDPISAEGILCYYWFGWELLDDLIALGFRDAYVALVSAREYGYLGQPQSCFVAIR